MNDTKDKFGIRSWTRLFGGMAFVCAFLALLLIGLGQWFWESKKDAFSFFGSDAFQPFVTGFGTGAIIAGSIVWMLTRGQYQEKLRRVKCEYECYRDEFRHLKLDFVVVEPLREHNHPDFVSPERHPVAAVINGKRYNEGDQVTDNLTVWVMTDDGATTSPDDFDGYQPNEPAVRLDAYTFHGAALTDEWEVTLVCFPRHKDGKKTSGPDYCFRMTTNRARYEDGSDASLARYNATFVDGRPLILPRHRKKHRQFCRMPDGRLVELHDSGPDSTADTHSAS